MGRVIRRPALLSPSFVASIILVASSAVAIEEGDRAPPWTAMDFAGRSMDFPELLDGKPAVVIFWATWCAYCKAFMPYLRDIQADYGTERINVLAIDVKEDGAEDPRAYVEGLAFPMIPVAEGDSIADAWGVEFVPGLMVLDSSGTVAFRRRSTEMPAGDTIASFWARQVRRTLDRILE